MTIGADRKSRIENWAENGRETGKEGMSLIARLNEPRRDGGHFEVFFTAINNPERTSFRELTRASRESEEPLR